MEAPSSEENGLPQIEHFFALDADFLAELVRPGALLIEFVGFALSHSPNAVRIEFLNKLKPEAKSRIYEILSQDILLQRSKYSAELILDMYFWELLYRTNPRLYHEFSLSQVFALDEIFPIDLIKRRDVLDLGCGTGRLLKHAIASGARRVLGVDSSRGMLDVARDRLGPGVELLEGTFGNIPLEDGTVDVVCSCMALGASNAEEAGRAVEEMMRILRPEGEIRVIVGAAHTARFLEELGFERLAIVRGYAPTPQDAQSSAVRALHQRASSSCADGAGRLFDWTPWTPEVTADAILRLISGACTKDVFPEGEISKPNCVPFYKCLKP